MQAVAIIASLPGGVFWLMWKRQGPAQSVLTTPTHPPEETPLVTHPYPITVDLARARCMKTAAADTTFTTCCVTACWLNGSPRSRAPMARLSARQPCCTISAKAKGGRITTCAAPRRACALLQGQSETFVEAVVHAIEAHRFLPSRPRLRWRRRCCPMRTSWTRSARSAKWACG